MWTMDKKKQRTANTGFAIAGFRASQTHLCKVEVQFSEQSLVLKLPAIANPRNVSANGRTTAVDNKIKMKKYSY